MSWLIGIICIVLVIYFWRIFLPLGILAGLGLGGFFLYEEHQREQRQKAEVEAAQQLRERIAAAQKNATSNGKTWVLHGEPDPASGRNVARTAFIESNDGLCYLSVQKRIDGTELTGLTCPDIGIPEHKDIEVKFDTRDVSQTMDLKAYTDSDDVYIPSYQGSSWKYLSYSDFMKGLVSANSVAIQIPAAGGFWTTFSLKGSAPIIMQLGKQLPIKKKSKSGVGVKE